MGAADNGEAEGALRLGLDGLAGAGAGRAAGLRLLGPDLSELFGVGEDEVHVLGPGISIMETYRGIGWRSRTLSKASICPVIWRPSMRVTLIRQLICSKLPVSILVLEPRGSIVGAIGGSAHT